MQHYLGTRSPICGAGQHDVLGIVDDEVCLPDLNLRTNCNTATYSEITFKIRVVGNGKSLCRKQSQNYWAPIFCK